MPEYLAPGVVIEETSFRARSIEGVGTSVAGLVGPTRTGPLRGVPEPVTSMNDFTRVFGDAKPLVFKVDGKDAEVPNFTALAAAAFFDNGGKQLYVSRVVRDGNSSDAAGDGSAAVRASKSSNNVTFRSRFPGAMGNYTLEVLWRDSENLLTTAKATTLSVGELGYLQAPSVPADVKGAGATLADGKFPVSIDAVVRGTANGFEIVAGTIEDKDGAAVTAAALGAPLDTGELPPVTRVSLRRPARGDLKVDDAVQLSLGTAFDISPYTTGGANWGTETTIRGKLKGAKLDTLVVSKGLTQGVAADFDVPLAALAALDPATMLMARRTFDIEVRNGGPNGEVVHTFANLSSATGQPESLDRRLPVQPTSRAASRTQPISCAFTGTPDVMQALNAMFDPDAITKPDKITGPRFLIKLENGTDGEVPLSGDCGGEIDDKGNTGLAAFEDIEDISILLAPYAAEVPSEHQAVVIELQKHCRKMRYRVGVVDAPAGATISEVREFRGKLGDESRLALYYPWVVTPHPDRPGETLAQPPSGFIAGIYAGTDVRRGVHKAPANETVVGALRFEQEINRFQQELLNPDGINCLRSFPVRGQLVWGARTLSADPEWKYVNVRRYFLYLERSIEKSTQWAVFEPNGEALWANVRTAVSDFLYTEWRNGHLLGETPRAAFFVRCDRSTMTQNDIDNGRLVCEVGVAALKPAEFVIFRIGQKTADN